MKSKVTLINIISSLTLQVVTVISGFIIPKIILTNFGSSVNGLVSSLNQFLIEQNRCAMACQGCGAVLFLLKSSGITFHNPLLLSYHTKQLN